MVYRNVLGVIAIVLMGVGLALPSVAGQSGSTFEVTITPVDPNDLRTFPEDLICEDVIDIRPGPSWNGITVGTSTLPELQATMHELYDQYVTWFDEGDGSTHIIQRGMHINAVIASHLPPSVMVCTQNGIITVLGVGHPYALDASQMYFSDLLKLLGRPDSVTGTDNFPSELIAFWFDEGIAARIYTANLEEYWLRPNPDDPLYGLITAMIYFPYQEVEGYEERWPYNRTRAFNPYLPPLTEGTMNPFDFDMLMATVTVQPSRTATPTYVPLPTSTPTPANS